MVTPIAQMRKLRPRQAGVGTLGPVPHPRHLLCNVTRGVRVIPEIPDAQGAYPAMAPSLSQRYRHTSAPLPEYTTQPELPSQPPSPTHTHTHTHTHTYPIEQHSSIPPTRMKDLLGSKQCTGCQSCDEQDGLAHSDRCPTPTTHNCTLTQHGVNTACHRHPRRSNKSPAPNTHSHWDTTGGPSHTSWPYIQPHSTPIRDRDSKLPIHLRVTSKKNSPHTQWGGVSQNWSQRHAPNYKAQNDTY